MIADRRVPASIGQASLWFLRQVMPCKTPYNTSIQLRLAGALDAGALTAAVRELVRRHESLRTTFAVTDSTVLQVIRDELLADVAVVDLCASGDPEAEVQRLARATAAEPFDLDQGPLLRVRLLRVGPDDHALVVVVDHIVVDGMSLGILWRELEALYGAFHAGEPSPLALPAKQYAACVEAQTRWLATPAFARQLGYWTDRLAGAAPGELPADRPRPPIRSFRGDLEIVTIPPPVVGRLRALCAQDDVSPFAALLAALDVLLARSTGEQDVVVMVPAACRQRFGADEVVGFFANLIVVRTVVPERVTYRALVQRVNQELVAGVLRQDVPFEKVIEALRPDRGPSSAPLVRIALSFLPVQASTLRLPGVASTYGEVPTGGAKYDLFLVVSERADDLTVSAEYNVDIFDAETIRALLERYRLLLASAGADPDRDVAELPLLAPAERERVLGLWNETRADYPREATVPGLVAAAAARAPAATAASFEGQEITYAELDRRSNQVARCLRARGVAPEVRVGVALERSIQMVVGLLGILKAGGAYVPLDPAYPRERLGFMAGDAGLRVLLTEDHLAELVPTPPGGLLRLDGDAAEIAAQRDEPLGLAIHPGSLAYVIYTSGSTGRPKGVQIPHRAVVNFLTTMAERPGLLPSDRLLAVTSLSFDIAGLELWLPLTVGAHVELASRATAGDGAALRRRLDTGEITVLQATPTTFRLLLEAGWERSPGLAALVGGEAVARDLATELTRRAASAWNMYGPTETTIWSSIQRLDAGEGPVTIGRPIANTRAYVLDRGLEPTPIGVHGELFLGGDGLARGYLGRPDLTAERFVPDPFEAGARLYRTGDLCRFRRDGALEFLGRLDQQVKVRGYRIELGEIEAVLAEHPAVQRAVVVARDGGEPSGTRLVAYVVGSPDAPLPDGRLVAELRALAQGRLPEYMVPSAFVVLDAIPLLPNGKIHRGALPAPGDARAEGGVAEAPRTPAEELLAGLWADVLGLERVGVRDDFFALGGHSLLGMRLLARVGDAFDVELPLRALFETRTVAALAERLAAARAGELPAPPPLVPTPRDGAPPLSFAQQRLWFLDQLEPDGIAYNLPWVRRLEGALDAGALERSLAEIVRRHEALRTTFATVDGEPRQVIAAAPSLAMPVIDLASLPEADREAEARRLADAEVQRPFSLSRGPLFRATLLRLAARDHVLVVNMHHIVSDGWSEGVLGRELAALYESAAAGRPSPLPELPVQIADHTAWQRAWLSGAALDAQIAYFVGQLRGAPAALELPTDRPRPALQSYQGTTSPLTLPRALVAGLGALARREGATLFMTLLAGFQVLLQRHAGQDDVVVGSPIAGRARAETEGLIGLFVNTLVLRTDLGGDPTVRELLARVREVTLDAYAHQDAPFERLVEALAPPRDLSRSALVQVMLILHNAPPAASSLGDVSSRRFDVERGTSKFDLTLWLEDTGEGLSGFLEYPTALFDAATIARMAAHLRQILEGAVADPARRISDLPLLTPDERRALLVTWNDTARPFAREACVHALFEARAAAAPEAVALAHEGRALTYRALNERANRLAHHLISLGAGPGALVGLAMDRSFGMVVGLLGILKAGAAYVPLDPTYPRERLAFVLDDAAIGLLVTEERLLGGLPEHAARVVLVDADGRGPSSAEDGDPAPRATAADRAYVIYTSGSTGKPKGVQIPHRAVVNFLTTMAERPGLSPSDRLLAVTSLSFDIAGLELWLPLTVGAAVEIVGRETAGDGAALRRLLDAGGITVMQATPTTFRLLLDAGWEGSPRLEVLIGGEAVPGELAGRLQGRAASIWNMYGPTETTIWSCIHRLEEGAPVLIGGPIANTQAHVLDRGLAPVPVGVTGELFLGGAGLADGYLGRPELTAERFVPDPFSGAPGARLYRTGDLCRRRADGALDFLGRADFQIKLRGHRIELGEIEAALAHHPAVREAIVIAYEERPGAPALAAYVTTRDGAAPSPADLRAHLRATLPEPMVPARFMTLERLPLTANNKIDRQALAALERPAVATNGADAGPRGALEHGLLAIWKEILGVEGLGVRDDFFDVGGHSLLAPKLFDRIARAFGVKLPIATLFQAPTVAQLGELLRRRGWAPSWSSLVPIQTSGSRPPFFCVHAVGGNVLNYRLLSRHLGEERPFYGLQARGLGGGEVPHATVEEMAAAYLREVRQEQPRGPYLIGGASSGGVVAYEMAQQLHAAGERVSALVMMDTYAAGPPSARVAETIAASPLHHPAVRLDYHLGNLLLRRPRAGIAYLVARMRARLGGVADPVEEAIHAATPDVRDVIASNMRALRSYVPRPYPGRAVMLLSREEPDRVSFDARLAWADLLEEGLILRFIPGNHHNMLDEPQVAGVAAVLARSLETP